MESSCVFSPLTPGPLLSPPSFILYAVPQEMHSPTLSTPPYPRKCLHPLAMKAGSPRGLVTLHLPLVKVWFSEVPRTTSRAGIHSAVSATRKASLPLWDLWHPVVPLSPVHLLVKAVWKTLGSHFHPAPPILRGFSNHVNNQSIILASLYHPHLGPSPGPQIYTSNCLPSSLSTPSHHMHPSFSLRCPLHFFPIAQACHFLSRLHAHYYFPPYYTYPLIFLPQLFPQPKSQRNKSICSPFLFLH